MRDSLDLLDRLFIVEVYKPNQKITMPIIKSALETNHKTKKIIKLIKMIILLPLKAEKTHKRKPKPLMWRKVKHDERFR